MTTINDFETFDGKHCETTATKCFLLHEEVDMTEPMVPGISQGFVNFKQGQDKQPTALRS